MLLRGAAVVIAWACLAAVGYSPADYPLRLAVRAFGRPVHARSSGHMMVSGGAYTVYRVKFEDPPAADDINMSDMQVQGWNRLAGLDLGNRTVYRLRVGFPFTTVDRYITVGLAFLLIQLLLPGFLGSGPTACRTGSPRVPALVLKTADVALAAWVVLGPFMYSAAQAWLTCVIWSALRLARLQGRIDLIPFRPPASEPPKLVILPSEAARIRQVRSPKRDAASFWAHTTPEGWSRLPGGAVAVGSFILAAVHARNRLVSAPVPGFRVFGLSLGAWSAVGWSLLAFALAVAVWEFFSAWRRSEE